MKYIGKLLLVLVIIVVFVQCSSEYREKDNDLSVNEFIFYMMRDVYLWYDRIPNVNYKAYDDPKVLYEAMLYRKYDRWSFMAMTDGTSDLEYNEENSFGFFPVWVNDGTDDANPEWAFKIAYVKDNSPAFSNGLTRGDEIVHINDLYLRGREPSELVNDLIYEQMNKDTSVTLHIVTKDNQDMSVALSRAVYTDNPIYLSKIINYNGNKVGYVVFNSFDYTGDYTDDDNDNNHDGLDSMMYSFDSGNITDLIIDLRYNGGGSVDVAAHFASLICGEEYESKVFNKGVLNNRNYENYLAPYINSIYDYFYNEGGYLLRPLTTQQNSFVYKFQKLTTSLNLERVIFITSESSASASESLIMGLRPFVEVVLIGDTTHGKPVGMFSIYYKNYVFLPIMFKGYNAVNEGEFFDGIPVDKAVADDLLHELGDETEACLSEALFYIDNGLFSQRAGDTTRIKHIPFRGMDWKNQSF